MIGFNNVCKSFSVNGGKPVSIIHNLNLEVEKGELVCVLGPSGCGKTTFLNLAAGFISPDSGNIKVEGLPVSEPGPDRGVVFQDSNLFPWLSVLNNVEFGLKQMKYSRSKCTEIASEYLKITGMDEHADKYPRALSGGMRQRVAIARVLALEPKIMLMDEPFSALDANTREHLQESLVKSWRGKDRTIIYVTHSVDEAAYLADRIIILGDAVTGIHADMHIKRSGERDRFSSEISSIQKELRAILTRMPCCISR